MADDSRRRSRSRSPGRRTPKANRGFRWKESRSNDGDRDRRDNDRRRDYRNRSPLGIATRTAITTATETTAREMVEAETIANLFAHHMMTALGGETGNLRMIQRSPPRRTRNPRLPLLLQAKK
ncbi:hypothetical protein V2G26_013657 [Clonostachys chloroleuca]